MNPQVEMEWCALWRALDGVSERLLRASEDMALSELHELRTELEALARQALQTSAAVPGGTSAVTGKASATTENPIAATENPIAATGISIAATGKPGAARGTAPRPSSVRTLALARASVALRSTFPPDEALIASLTEAAAHEVQMCPPDSRQALALAYLHAATYAEGWRRASESLLRHLPSDALTREARTLLAALEVEIIS